MAQSHSLTAPLPRIDLVDDRSARADPASTGTSLLTLLQEIEANPPRPAAYLHSLERLRKPILLAQEDLEERFAGKPVPLGQEDSAALARACDLWIASLRAYRRLLSAAMSGEHPELQASLALLCQRALACTRELIVARFLARREILDGYWRSLHEAYGAAQSRGVAESVVADVGPEPTPASAYAESLLMQLANPYGLSQQEFVLLRRWAAYFAGKVKFVRGAPQPGGYAVDLAGHCAPQWTKAGTETETTRFLELADVSSSVRKRIRKLEEGVDPAVLGLGNDCTGRVAADLLNALGRAWLEAPAKRDFSRTVSASPTLLASGFAAIHRALGENSRAASAAPVGYSYGEADRLHTLQRAYETGANWESRVPGLENWERFEESAKEFRLRRTEPGAALALRQLVALRPRGARQFILCEVRSLSEGADRLLTVAAHPLPGIVKPCTVRSADQKTQSPSQALMLPAGPGLPAVLLLPTGWYRSGREIEVHTGGNVIRVRLTALLDRGFDYERVQTGDS